MAARDFDIELELLIDAIYLKYHYDFRRYAAGLAQAAPDHGDGALRVPDAVTAPGQGAARAGGLPGALELPHRAGQRDVSRPGLLPVAAPRGRAAAEDLSRR